VIGTDCIGIYKLNYHTMTTTTAPFTCYNVYHHVTSGESAKDKEKYIQYISYGFARIDL
jgi:hypothetical protein